MQVNEFYKEQIKYSIDEVRRFAEISGDFNPIHLDEEYASKTIFKKPIVHGMLVASIFSKILGTKIPGEGTIYRKQSLNFMKPVFLGVTYEAIVKIIEIDSIKASAKLDCTILDNSGEIVLSGEAIVYNQKFKGL